ncbi:putative Pentalenene synthase [Streptomyces viridochromogenes Tue57]|uniref:Putative Pentalenene synthase n=1 Tax=Streptomyces viridochromogenes Tue57 TaxID=1160705 RepID=L8PMB2_STRVR|nr:putative Pentalenene synthase [Streptomyces viridochromogenes Tue57]
MPFLPPPPASAHPHYGVLTATTQAFLTAHGVLRTPSDVDRFRRHDLAMWTVFCYPDCPLESQQLIADFIALAAEWDHLLSQPEGRGRATELISPLKDITENRAPSGNSRFLRAWADVWRRWCEGMPAPWCARTAEHWSAIFAALIDEDLTETAQAPLTIGEKCRLRDETGLQSVLFDLIERGGGFTLPSRIRDLAPIQSMLFHANRQIWVTNEVQSLPKELADGESNLVLLLEAAGKTRSAALAEVHRMVRSHTDTFLAAEAATPRALDELAVPVEERVDVYRFIAGMRTIMAGTATWCGNSGRYQQYVLDR